MDSFPANGYGSKTDRHVWEWVAPWSTDDFAGRDRDQDPRGPDNGTVKAQNGGSDLCHDSYCRRYRVAARQGSSESRGNVGSAAHVTLDDQWAALWFDPMSFPSSLWTDRPR